MYASDVLAKVGREKGWSDGELLNLATDYIDLVQGHGGPAFDDWLAYRVEADREADKKLAAD